MAPKSSQNNRTDTGILLDKKLPVPSSRNSEPRLRSEPGGGPVANKTLALIAGGALLIGGVVGFLVRPRLMKDPKIAKLETSVSNMQASSSADRERAATAESKLKVVTATKGDLEKQLEIAKKAQTQLADKAADADKKAKAQDAAQTKLQAALDKSSGSVSSEGDEIRLQLIDKVLFKVGDDQLTDRGKAILAKVGKALAELDDKQIWVQGHTDDSPIFIPAAPKKPVKGAPPPTVRFASNWELSAARALTVVHYLQDTAKLDPSRLAALAFGQYRPVSRANKAANRRIEIVLYPHRAVIKR